VPTGHHDPVGLQLGDHYADTWPRALTVSAFGLLVLLLWPWLQRVPLALDRWLLPRLLGPTEAALRVMQLTETRDHALNEAAAAAQDRTRPPRRGPGPHDRPRDAARPGGEPTRAR
jgi:hypothetical protein